jgi:hypothetical protein
MPTSVTRRGSTCGAGWPTSRTCSPHRTPPRRTWSRSQDEASQALDLLAVMEAYRHKRNSPAVPGFLQASYDEAMRAAARIVLSRLTRDVGEDEMRSLLSALATVRGHPRLGMAIGDLEAEVECPGCEHVFSPPGWDLNEPSDDR